MVAPVQQDGQERRSRGVAKCLVKEMVCGHAKQEQVQLRMPCIANGREGDDACVGEQLVKLKRMKEHACGLELQTVHDCRQRNMCL